MQYTNKATDQSNEIHETTFWCYFDAHRNITRISNNPPENVEKFKGTKKKLNTPGTITQKFSFNKTNSKILYEGIKNISCRYQKPFWKEER